MFAVGIPRSLLPRPKPFTTGPERGMGKGGVGPVGGPAVRGRGWEGRICVGGVGWGGGWCMGLCLVVGGWVGGGGRWRREEKWVEGLVEGGGSMVLPRDSRRKPYRRMQKPTVGRFDNQ